MQARSRYSRADPLRGKTREKIRRRVGYRPLLFVTVIFFTVLLARGAAPILLPLGEGKGEGIVLAADGDVVFKRDGEAGGTPPALFPHWSHRIRYKCYACHPEQFEMKAGADKITMDAIREGKFCGACHNGKTAWAVSFETCSRCHVGK